MVGSAAELSAASAGLLRLVEGEAEDFEEPGNDEVGEFDDLLACWEDASIGEFNLSWQLDLPDPAVREDPPPAELPGDGTTGPMTGIMLTANEVELARAKHPRTALYVVHDINLTREPEASEAIGGTIHKLQPWLPEDARLRATVFLYRLDGD